MNWTIVTAVLVIALLGTWMFTFTVDDGSQAVVYTFGAIREEGIKTKPGLYFRWPAGIQRIVPVDVRGRVLNVRGNEPVTTRDQHPIYLSLTIAWRVVNAETFIKRVSSADGATIDENANRFLHDRVRDTRTRVLNQFDLSTIITPDAAQRQAFKRLEETLLATLVRETARSDYGVEIDSIQITRIAPARDSTQKIFESMIEERKKRSEKNITDGKAEAQQIINQANLERQNMLSQAMADARRTKGEGDAAAAEFYKEFKENPQLANFLRRLDTLEEVLKRKATIALPSSQPLDGLISLPAPAGK